MNKRCNISVEVITPLAVGAGNANDWIRGVDYVVKNSKVYILDLERVVALGVDVDKLSALLSTSDEKGICNLLGGRLEAASRYVFDLPKVSTNPIKAFLRSQLHDRPLVAGSSLKGSIRSVLFTYLRQHREENNQAVFGSLKDGTDFMRFIQVGDVEMPSTSLVNTRLFNLWNEEGSDVWHGGWKHGDHNTNAAYLPMNFNTLYECVLPGSIGRGSISFANDGFKAVLADPSKKVKYETEKKALLEGGTEELFNVINNATWNYLQNEMDFFERYQEAEKSQMILDGIKDLIDMVPDKGDNSSCLLKMSAGSGYHSITGDWQFDDYDLHTWGEELMDENGHFDKDKLIKWGLKANKAKEKISKKMFKSRKIAEHDGKLLLMGFVRLTAL